MRHYIISEEELNKLRSAARSLFNSNIPMFTGQPETTRDLSFKIKEVIEAVRELNLESVKD
jgi:hypothetical protein